MAMSIFRDRVESAPELKFFWCFLCIKLIEKGFKTHFNLQWGRYIFTTAVSVPKHSLVHKEMLGNSSSKVVIVRYQTVTKLKTNQQVLK